MKPAAGWWSTGVSTALRLTNTQELDPSVSPDCPAAAVMPSKCSPTPQQPEAAEWATTSHLTASTTPRESGGGDGSERRVGTSTHGGKPWSYNDGFRRSSGPSLPRAFGPSGGARTDGPGHPNRRPPRRIRVPLSAVVSAGRTDPTPAFSPWQLGGGPPHPGDARRVPLQGLRQLRSADSAGWHGHHRAPLHHQLHHGWVGPAALLRLEMKMPLCSVLCCSVLRCVRTTDDGFFRNLCELTCSKD